MWGDVGRCREIQRAEALEALHTRDAAALGPVFPGYHPKVFPGYHPRHAAALEPYLPIYLSISLRTYLPYISQEARAHRIRRRDLVHAHRCTPTGQGEA